MIDITKFRPQGIFHFHMLNRLMQTGLLELPGVGVEFPDDSHVKVLDKFGHYSLFEHGDDDITEVERG